MSAEPIQASSEKLKKKSNYDLVIVGGGTVGCCMALAILRLLNQNSAATPTRIAIVEARQYDPTQPHPGFDGRAIALAGQSLDFLAQLGLQQSIELVTEAIRHIHVSDRGFLGQCELNAEQLGVPELGRVIELHDFGRILHETLKAENEDIIDWYCPDTLAEVHVQKDKVALTTKTGKQLTANLLLVTDGGESGTRELLKLTPSIRDYEQVALITNVRTSQPHQQKAFERFTEHGPLAFLPMTDNRCSVVWTLPHGAQHELLELSDGEFMQRLQAAFGHRLGNITQVGERVVYPLRLVQAEGSYLHRVALLGNAAQTLHPIAGQGFNLGLRDVQDMLGCLFQAKEQGREFGDYRTLSEFRQLRQKDSGTTIAATHGLVNLFSNRSIPLVMGRNLGLLAMQFLPAFKKPFAQRAMGRR